MILIFSQLNREASTDAVIEWLRFFKHPYKRINTENVLYSDFTISITEESSNNIFGENINSIWFRRWATPYLEIDRNTIETKESYFAVVNFLLAEYWSSCNPFFNSLSKANWLSHPSNASMDKISVLQLARKNGILTPNSILTNNKKDLITFIKEQGTVVTKALTESLILDDDENMYCMYTSEIDDLELIPDNFPFSLFQQKISKEFEIRSFYLDGEFYSMAIFSQSNKKTEIDFRKYDFNKPNRTIPFQLPIEIQHKLKNLMQELNLNTGSIDLIYSSKKEFVFLEVNPVGQFGMTSYPCNYQIEKKVAEYLIKNDTIK